MGDTAVAGAVISHLTDTGESLERALRRAKYAIPATPRRYVKRDMLTAQLRALVTGDSTGGGIPVVSAPVGYGKTNLAASLARELPTFGMAWCSLEDSDNDPY